MNYFDQNLHLRSYDILIIDKYFINYTKKNDDRNAFYMSK